MKHILLFVGPSGSGKTTVANRLEELFGLKQTESYTTRPPRYPGEKGHVFVSDAEMDELMKDAVAFTTFNGYRYCDTNEHVEQHDIYVIDPHGVETFKDRYTGDKQPIIFYFDTPIKVCKQRMLDRGDSAAAVKERIKHDLKVFRKFRKQWVHMKDTYMLDATDSVEGLCNSIMSVIDFREMVAKKIEEMIQCGS